MTDQTQVTYNPPPANGFTESQEETPARYLDFLDRDAILSAPDTLTVAVPVPEWGGTVYIRSITVAERERIEKMFQTDQKGRNKVKNLREELLIMSIINPNTGDNIFNRGDINKLSKKSAGASERVFEASLKLSGFKKEDVDQMVDDFIEGQTVE